jgi:hypothetical protein
VNFLLSFGGELPCAFTSLASLTPLLAQCLHPNPEQVMELVAPAAKLLLHGFLSPLPSCVERIEAQIAVYSLAKQPRKDKNLPERACKVATPLSWQAHRRLDGLCSGSTLHSPERPLLSGPAS